MTFVILYRDLIKQDPHKRARDTSFSRERKEILNELGLINDRKLFTERPKHHGKLARMKETKIDNKSKLEQAKKRENDLIFNRYSNSIKELSSLTNQIHQLNNNKQYIDNSHIRMIENQINQACSILNPGHRQNSINDRNPKGLIPNDSVRLPKLKNNEKRQKISFNKTFSSNKWTNDERNRLEKILQDSPLPTNKRNKSLWTLYFSAIADQHITFFPKRSKQDIIEKAQKMISFRQIKYSGEEDYWQKFKK